MIKRLLNELNVGDIMDSLTLDLAKPMVIKLAQERLAKNNLTSGEEDVLKTVVDLNSATATELSQKLVTSRQYVSKTLIHLCEENLLEVKHVGRNRVYFPVLDVVIAYSRDT